MVSRRIRSPAMPDPLSKWKRPLGLKGKARPDSAAHSVSEPGVV